MSDSGRPSAESLPAESLPAESLPAGALPAGALPAGALPGEAHFDGPGLPDDDPNQWPVADEDPQPPPEDELPQWLVDELSSSEEAEHASWLATLPEDIRADYLTGPYTGAGESIAPGFTHRDAGGPSGAGFAAGGVLDQLAPGPWLAEALASATAAGYTGLTDSEQIGVLLGWQREVAWAQAGLAAAVSGVRNRRLTQSRRPGWKQVTDHITDEIAIALRLTSLSAGRLLGQSAGLDRLPEVAGALSTGQIDWARACLLVGELAVLTDEQAQAIASRLLREAAEQTTAELRAALTREILTADPQAAERRKKEGGKDARVEVWQEPSGNAVLAGRELRSSDAIAADAQLTSDARWLRGHGASGTLAELRAAAFITRLSGRALTSALPAGDSGASQGGSSRGSSGGGPADTRTPGCSINLTMPLSAFAGLSERPGEAAGHGTIDAPTGRDLAARFSDGARWCLTLTGPDGRAVAHACARRGDRPEPGTASIRWAAGLADRLEFLEAGTCRHARWSARYTPPAALRHLVGIRQRTCFAPGCRRPAARCDIDHTVPFEHGGITCECNTAPACRRHHRCKQAPGWHVAQDQPGVMTWRVPGGRRYTTTGDAYPA
jgi:hypothetical protein